MHASVRSFFADVVAKHDLAGRATVEVGSLDVNGTIRDLWSGVYVGVDLRAGIGVDRVADGERLPFEDGSWPVVVSAECLEHCLRPWAVLAEMARVCEPSGHVVVSMRGFDEWGCFRQHGHPDDFWRPSMRAFRTMLEDAGLDVVELLDDPMGPGFFAHARKPQRDVYRASS